MSPVTIHKAEAIGPNLQPNASWWNNYCKVLKNQGFTKATLAGISEDSKYIHARIMESHLSFDLKESKHVSKGLVFGAIQSGKTSSMFGVASLCIDSGFNIILFLSGTRIALWKQTYQRLQKQLDIAGNNEEFEKNKIRVLLPTFDSMELTASSGDAGIPLSKLYSAHPNAVQRAIRKKRPIIFTVMKHCDHIRKFKEYLRSIVTVSFMKECGQVKLLIVDDEADDGSILDRRIENGQFAQYEFLKQLPRAITDIWTDDFFGNSTFDNNLSVTYLAYTATPQANILQSEHNPLYPSDFVATIRAPGHLTGKLYEESAFYQEPAGISYFYTGGDIFYETTKKDVPGSFCITNPKRFIKNDKVQSDSLNIQPLQLQEDLLLAGLRSFLVSAAIRLYISNKKYSESKEFVYDSKQECLSSCPDIHTALIHPSALRTDHFRFEKIIRNWLATGVLSFNEKNDIQSDRDIQSIEGAINDLNLNEELWSLWLKDFEDTRKAINKPGIEVFAPIDEGNWIKIKSLLSDEILPSLRLKIINSDQDADDRPSFDPIPLEGGRFKTAEDILTIFISGNVMSRGITIEGLTTSIFLRTTNQPLQDTQMQMQRWFGYRGKHIIWCRLFTDPEQYQLFRDYHNKDQALRCLIASEMAKNTNTAIDPVVLSGNIWDATGKIDNLSKIPLFPGKSPFINLIYPINQCLDPNIEVVHQFFTSNEFALLKTSPKDTQGKGYISKNPISLMDGANLLDKLRFPQHQPNPNNPVYKRWKSILSLLPITDEIINTPTTLPPFYQGINPTRCPYSIAAYMRFWNYCLTNRVPGIFKNNRPDVFWNYIDLEKEILNAPKFFVGIRFGGSHAVSESRLKQININGQLIKTVSRTINQSGHIQSGTWGSRNPGDNSDNYLGDEWFDYHHTEKRPSKLTSGELYRPEGSSGLILFYILDLVDFNGQPIKQERVATGVCLPIGGPDTMATMNLKI